MVAAVAAVPVLAPASASAEGPSVGKSTGRHCVLDVTGQKPDGEMITAPMRCYSTYDELLASEGVVLSTPSESRSAVESFQQASRLLDTLIAIHYVDINGGGNSLSINGSCSNGWRNMPAGFVNNISSTWTNCPHVRHYADIALGGGTFDTAPNASPQNITGTMNDNTESAKYMST